MSFTYQAGTPFAGDGIKDVSGTIHDGSYTAIIGHTGSGKSTILQHLNALLKPTSGTVTIGDKVITNETSNKNLKPLRQKVGMVFQFAENQLFEQTVAKDIAFGPQNFGVSEQDALALADKMITMVGLPHDVLEKSPFDLSGGQMRRVAIAGVLAMQPEVLVLDEPTAGLDPAGRHEMMQMFERLHREEGQTIVLVTHQASVDKLLLGRYIPGHSWIHELDPRTKLMASFYYIGIVFLANNWQTYLMMFVATLFMIWLSGIKLGFFLRGVRPLIWLILFTVALQVLFVRGGTVYWHWGWLWITKLGLINGAFIFVRFVLIIFMSTLLTLTTQPLSLADAVESLLKPLRVIHVPVTELALVLQIALRFVPTLMDQTTKIMNAQRARGVDFGEGNIFQQMKAVVPLLIPLFVSSFTTADELATAMEARGYQGGDNRTKYRILRYHQRDWIAAGGMLVLTGLLLLLRAY